jgi:hypothetical protein
MTPQEQNMQEFQELQHKYLNEAIELFGPKTEYQYIGLFYHNFSPRVVMHDYDFLTDQYFYKIELCGKAINDRTDGIFQLSHEVVHLLSPIEQVDGNEVNYLEEGMATYFSKLITERDTGNYDFCHAAIANRPNYLRAFELYKSLAAIDEYAVRKIRVINPVIAAIEPEDFEKAGIAADPELIEALLDKF